MRPTPNDAPPRRPRAWRRSLGWAGGALVLVALVLWCTADGSPVGHFASASDKDRFIAAYGTAMAALPKPGQTRDIRTTFGIVRVYQFSGAHDALAPLPYCPDGRRRRRSGPTTCPACWPCAPSTPLTCSASRA